MTADHGPDVEAPGADQCPVCDVVTCDTSCHAAGAQGVQVRMSDTGWIINNNDDNDSQPDY